jgi:methylated-DNA-protein-cysteine methyltransferase related protein
MCENLRLSSGAWSETVIAWVCLIPVGRVATYGQIAALSGKPRASRQVGRVLNCNNKDIPWHRVVNAQGKISTLGQIGDLQKQLLSVEGIHFNSVGICSLKKYLWQPQLK